MRHLTALPDELLSLIATNIDSRQSLCNLALTCKTLNRISTPYIYAQIHLESGNRSLRWVMDRLRSLTCSCLVNPNLAHLVRSLTIDSDIIGGFGDEPDSEYSLQLEKIIVDTSIKFSQSKDEEMLWLNFLQSGARPTAIISILLSTLTKLKKLCIEPMQLFFIAIVQCYNHEQRLSPGFQLLGQLSEVTIEESSVPYEILNKYFGFVLQLHCIQAVYARKLFCDTPDARDINPNNFLETFEPRTSSVTHIELQECMIWRTELQALLRAPKSLETFMYECHNEEDLGSFKRIEEILELLKPQKNSLENLWLYIHPDAPYGLPQPMRATSMQNLSNFSVLKHVIIDAIFLFGYSMPGERPLNGKPTRLLGLLPKSLQTIRVRNCETNLPDITTTLEMVLVHKREYTPDLRKLFLEGITVSEESIIYDDFISEQPMRWVKRLGRVAKKMGVFYCVLRDNFSLQSSVFSLKNVQIRNDWGMDGMIVQNKGEGLRLEDGIEATVLDLNEDD